jgi:hypothetical protein
MAKIKKLLVQEVSLAAFPKNGKRFTIIKDSKEGGSNMDRVLKLMAFLSTKTAEVPEVVKEELKNIAKDVSTSDVLDVFKDLLIGYIVEQKKEGVQIVDTNKFDVVAKDTWIVKPIDKTLELPAEIKKELDDNRKMIADLKLNEFKKDALTKVGATLAKEFESMFGKLADADITKFLDIVKFQQDIINELGKAQLVKGNTYAVKAAEVEANVKKLADERKISVLDAWPIYAKEHPEDIAKLDQ